LKISELNFRQSVKPRIADERRRIDYLRRKLEGWLRRRRIGDERRRGTEAEGGGRTEEEA
jgi:hypothetical protein